MTGIKFFVLHESPEQVGPDSVVLIATLIILALGITLAAVALYITRPK